MQTKTGGRRVRRRFTSEFKAGAVVLVLDENKTIGAVARELDLTPSSLGSWVARAQADRTKGRSGLTSEERAELARLRKENRELRMERDILKNCRVFTREMTRARRPIDASIARSVSSRVAANT